jgi:hypothetical protein
LKMSDDGDRKQGKVGRHTRRDAEESKIMRFTKEAESWRG